MTTPRARAAPGCRILLTARGRFVITRTGIVIGCRYRKPTAKPAPRAVATAANDDKGPDIAGGIAVAAGTVLAVWAGFAAAVLYFRTH